MLTVPELKALAVGLDLKLGSRNSSNRPAMLAWYSRTLLSPAPGTVSIGTWSAVCWASGVGVIACCYGFLHRTGNSVDVRSADSTLQEPAVEPKVLAAHLEALVGPCCRLTLAAATLMGRVRRLFFMSEHQDLSRFLVTNLGITKYPQYRFGNLVPRREGCCCLLSSCHAIQSIQNPDGQKPYQIGVQAESAQLRLSEAPGHAGV